MKFLEDVLFLLLQVKSPQEEEALANAAGVQVDLDDEAARTQALSERLYEDDCAEAVQAKMLNEKHDPIQDPKKSWSFGNVGSIDDLPRKKTRL